MRTMRCHRGRDNVSRRLYACLALPRGRSKWSACSQYRRTCELGRPLPGSYRPRGCALTDGVCEQSGRCQQPIIRCLCARTRPREKLVLPSQAYRQYIQDMPIRPRYCALRSGDPVLPGRMPVSGYLVWAPQRREMRAMAAAGYRDPLSAECDESLLQFPE